MLLKRKYIRSDIDKDFQYQYKRFRMRNGCSEFCNYYPKCFLGCRAFRLSEFGYALVKKI